MNTQPAHGEGAYAYRDFHADVAALTLARSIGARLTPDHGIRVITDLPNPLCGAMTKLREQCFRPVGHSGEHRSRQYERREAEKRREAAEK